MIRKYVVRQICDLIDTVQCGITYACTTESDAVEHVLGSCQDALNQILQTVQNEALLSAGICAENIHAVLEELHSSVPADYLQTMKKRLRIVQQKLKQEPVRFEVAFFPYKFSMWDCMESVWQAAQADPDCDCYVVPIPYYDRNQDRSLGPMHYEGTQFPPNVQAVDYRSYDPAVRRPDIAYIHNPYDDQNLVTSVHPHYYSESLKQHVGTLVYIPYYITGYANAIGEGVTLGSPPAYRHADYLVAQSDGMKRGWIDLGIPEDRILALGNPKFDTVLNHKPAPLPDEWRKPLEGRTTFLINTSLQGVLSHTEQWLLSIQEMIQHILDTPGCAVIWRPHPLMDAAIKSMRPKQMPFYQKAKAQLAAYKNFVLDVQPNSLQTFDASHAFLSDYSSLIWQYGATGKPVLCFMESSQDGLKAKYPMLDYSKFYFVKDGVSPEAFVDMVHRGQDPMKEERMAALKASVIHMDGTAGEHIHQSVIKRIIDDEEKTD